jgi:predicted tellurium resistance membrane protein TerC
MITTSGLVLFDLAQYILLACVAAVLCGRLACVAFRLRWGVRTLLQDLGLGFAGWIGAALVVMGVEWHSSWPASYPTLYVLVAVASAVLHHAFRLHSARTHQG